MKVSDKQQKTNVHVFMPLTDDEKRQFEAFIQNNSLKKGEWIKRIVFAEITKSN